MAARFTLHAVPRHWGDDFTRMVMAAFCCNHLGSKWSSAFGPREIEAVRASTMPDGEKQELLAGADAARGRLTSEEQAAVAFMDQYDQQHPVWKFCHRAASVLIEAETDGFRVGDVSWLKANILGDADRYIPTAIDRMADLVGEDLPILTPDLKEKLLVAYSMPDAKSIYKLNVGLAYLATFDYWLDQHMGERLFHVSW